EKGIKEGMYTGWDDVKLATLRALKKRGFEPEAIRNYWISAGIKEVDIKFSWENLYAYNKEIIDSKANRYFFVDEPVKIRLFGAGKLNAKIPLHPDFEERGKREHEVENFVYLSKMDIEENIPIRLKSLCNIEFINMNEARYIGSELIEGIKIIHWVPEKFIKTKIYMPDGKILNGIAEEYAKNDIGNVVQFERFGFVRIEKFENELVCYFLHK
ncbi:MAG: glutamate--tRNA ligase, partial [Candidatus Thermoplasmatota archaeon]